MRQKLLRYKEVGTRSNIIEEGNDLFTTVKGAWSKKVFENNNDITLELGCGRGEYTVALAKKYPEKNYIGMDIKGDRIWIGSSDALFHQLSNVVFLRSIIQHLDQFFYPEEVSEIWITFPDPRPKGRDERRRLTQARFMDMYLRILKPGGILHLKTDNTDFFDYTLDILKKYKVNNLRFTYDLYESPLLNENLEIKTNFEQIFTEKGEKIKYLCFQK